MTNIGRFTGGIHGARPGIILACIITQSVRC